MTERDDTISMEDMRAHAIEAVQMLGRQTRDDLRENRMLQLALTRLVEIIGEAANRVSLETRQRYPQLPWPRIIGMRNRLAHGYDVLDLNLVFDTVRADLPPLIETLNQIFDSKD